MRILENHYTGGGERTVHCSYCHSKLSITDADVRLSGERSVVKCPCCKRDFGVMTERELTEAYYRK